MKKILKVSLIVLACVIAVMLVIIVYVTQALPNVGAAPDIKIAATAKRLARGKYLATYVAGCLDCHSERDLSKYSAPLFANSLGKGGEILPVDAGKVIAPNITPFALGNWTDGEIYRAITSGVSRDGHALFPIMPYQSFGKMATEDIYSIIAYIRTLTPIKNTPERSKLDFPVNIIVHTIPSKPSPGKVPDVKDSVLYGKYIIEAANCKNCHSPMKKGQFIDGMAYSGGMQFNLPGGRVVRSANITPDKETGIGSWTKDIFMARFRAALDNTYTHAVSESGQQTVMPWTNFARMDEKDLAAIYAYLRTVKPVKNKINKFSAN